MKSGQTWDVQQQFPGGLFMGKTESEGRGHQTAAHVPGGPFTEEARPDSQKG